MTQKYKIITGLHYSSTTALMLWVAHQSEGEMWVEPFSAKFDPMYPRVSSDKWYKSASHLLNLFKKEEFTPITKHDVDELRKKTLRAHRMKVIRSKDAIAIFKLMVSKTISRFFGRKTLVLKDPFLLCSVQCFCEEDFDILITQKNLISFVSSNINRGTLCEFGDINVFLEICGLSHQKIPKEFDFSRHLDMAVLLHYFASIHIANLSKAANVRLVFEDEVKSKNIPEEINRYLKSRNILLRSLIERIGIFVKVIEYKPRANRLNEKDVERILSLKETLDAQYGKKLRNR